MRGDRHVRRGGVMLLHGYWRSTASYRTRIALNYKGLVYRSMTHNLRLGEQRSSAFLERNPQGLVPVLDLGDALLAQSPAILEWLEEAYPSPPLLPRSAFDAALVRSMAAIIACDVHPLNNLRVLTALKAQFGASAVQIDAWIAGWIGDGFAALEPLIARHGDGFAFGSCPTIADCCLVPQVYSAERFGVDLSPYPCLMAAASAARGLAAFADAHPDHQPDADQS